MVDDTGLIADWDLVDPDAFEAGFASRLGRYTGGFGIDTTTIVSTGLTIFLSALPRQQTPVARVSLAEEDLHIDVTPGPSPGDCAAMSVPYAFRLQLREPLGDRTVSATLIDPIAQQRFEFTRKPTPP